MRTTNTETKRKKKQKTQKSFRKRLTQDKNIVINNTVNDGQE